MDILAECYANRTYRYVGGYSMRYMAIAAVLGMMLATQAQAESKTYRTVLIQEKSVQACFRMGPNLHGGHF